MKQSKAKPPRSLARLDRERRTLGIELADVAAEAMKTSARRSVGIATVSNVLAGRTKSANVVAALRRLIDSKKTAAA